MVVETKFVSQPSQVELFYPDKIFYIFDKLIEQDKRLYLLNTPQPEKNKQRLDGYQDNTDKASYFWKNDQGLYRTDLPNIYVPHTASLLRALEHIALSIHFGFYLFTDIGDAMQSHNVMKVLASLAENNHQHHKIIMFAGQDLDIPYFLEKKFTLIEHELSISTLPRAKLQYSTIAS